MTTHTAYKFTVSDTEFQVKVAGRHERHPLNWSSYEEGYSLEGVRYQAAIQHLPVVFIDEDGTRHGHGVQFTAGAFERAAYRGYIAYGVSMTDGHYAPVDFEAWVTDFRRFPEANLKYNDFYPAPEAMAMYLG